MHKKLCQVETCFQLAALKVLKRFLNGVASAAVLAHAALSAVLEATRWGACGAALVLLPRGDECVPGCLAWLSGPAGLPTVGRPRASAGVRGCWRDGSRSLWPADSLPTVSVWGECRGGEVSNRHLLHHCNKWGDSAFWMGACKLASVAGNASNDYVVWFHFCTV